MLLLCVIDCTRFAYHVDLDLAGIIQLVLDLLGDFAGEKHHLVVRNLLRIDDNANLAACLNGKRTGNTGRLVGDALELLQTLDIVL